MKMHPSHIAHIKVAIAPLDTPFYRDRYVAAGLSDARYQWDLFHAAKLTSWACSDLYPCGLHDDHIATVLKRLVVPLVRKVVA